PEQRGRWREGLHEAHSGARSRRRGDDGRDPASAGQGHRRLPGLSARTAQVRPRGVGRHLSAQGRAAAACERRHLPLAGRVGAVQGNPGAVMAGPSDQDKLSDDWGLDDIEAAPDLANMAEDLSEEERAAAAAAEWAAMLEGDTGDGD